MRKLTTVAALVLSLSLAAPAVTLAASTHAPKTRSSTVREDQGPRNPDLISRVILFIKAHLPLHSSNDASPIIPTP